MRCKLVADKFLLWLAQCRSDVSSIHLRTQSPRAACQREATTSNYTAWLPPAPNFDLVYFWLVCLSDATIQTIVSILWPTITIYCGDGVRRVSLAHTCSFPESTVSTRSLSCALSIAWSSSLSIKLFLLPTVQATGSLCSYTHSFIDSIRQVLPSFSSYQ